MKIPAKDRAAIQSRTLAARVRQPNLNRSYVIPILSSALRIVDLLQETEEPLNLGQICSRTGIAKTTAYRILRTLAAYGYFPDGAYGVYCFKNRQPFNFIQYTSHHESHEDSTAAGK